MTRCASMIDIAIIGAGPAGAVAAWRLARGGARVAIFDPSHPREKPCGGGVTARALALVADMVDPRAVASTPIRAARFTSVFTPGAFDDPVVPLNPEALVVASRRVFDTALLDAALAAGATLRRRRVRDV